MVRGSELVWFQREGHGGNAELKVRQLALAAWDTVRKGLWRRVPSLDIVCDFNYGTKPGSPIQFRRLYIRSKNNTKLLTLLKWNDEYQTAPGVGVCYLLLALAHPVNVYLIAKSNFRIIVLPHRGLEWPLRHSYLVVLFVCLFLRKLIERCSGFSNSTHTKWP